jgi:tight adherence protein C
MFSQTMTPVFLALLLLTAGPVLLVLSLRWFKEEDISDRLNEFVADPNSGKSKVWTPTLAVRSRGLSGSMLRRVFLPALKGIGNVFGRLTPTRQLQELGHQLIIAGNPLGLEARQFFGISLVINLLGVWVAYMVLRSRGLDRNNLLMALVLVGIAYLYPRTWLRGRMRKRQDKVRKGLPDALDMLSVCATAGLGFDQAMQRVSEHWKTPVGMEFGRVITEMEMGLSRREALRNLADRLDIPELTSFISFIVQTDQLGMSIVDTLHAQADQLRIERRNRAQEQAQKIPTKMLIPMAFLIFPALLAIILGPIVPSMISLMSQMTN